MLKGSEFLAFTIELEMLKREMAQSKMFSHHIPQYLQIG